MNQHELEKKVLRFARAVLDDDQGISEQAYNQMVDLLDYLGVGEGLLREVDGVDGRFFIATQENEE